MISLVCGLQENVVENWKFQIRALEIEDKLAVNWRAYLTQTLLAYFIYSPHNLKQRHCKFKAQKMSALPVLIYIYMFPYTACPVGLIRARCRRSSHWLCPNAFHWPHTPRGRQWQQQTTEDAWHSSCSERNICWLVVAIVGQCSMMLWEKTMVQLFMLNLLKN